MSATYDEVLTRLKEQRCDLSMSQNEMARIVHMTQSNYSKVELSLRRLNFNELKYLCESPIDVYYIFTGFRSDNKYMDFIYNSSYWELSRYIGIIYEIVDFNNKNDATGKWKKILKRMSCVPLIRGIQNSQNVFLELRHFMNLQQKKMAEKLGIDIKKFRDLEKGRNLPDSELIWRLYDSCYVSPTILLEDRKCMASEIATILDMIETEYQEKIIEIFTKIQMQK
ncbi:MAG: helix-turn-helix domain-containing protein [Lachnospiraceae bacterium]|nr:helix-turn-helix domain-containing protein [Lachnospiraceae bacterium]